MTIIHHPSSLNNNIPVISLNSISSLFKQMKDIVNQIQPFLVVSCSHMNNNIIATLDKSIESSSSSYNHLLHLLSSLAKDLYRILVTHSDIVTVRYISIVLFMQQISDINSNEFQWDIRGDIQDLPSMLVQLLYLTTQLWFHSITFKQYSCRQSIEIMHRRHTNEEHEEEEENHCNLLNSSSNNNHIANTEESKLLFMILRLHSHITTIDCVLGEEIVKAGSHTTLSHIIQYDITKILSSSSAAVFTEMDKDFIYDIQDMACSIQQIPIFLTPLFFPIKTIPYSYIELYSRLPIPFSLVQSLSSSSSSSSTSSTSIYSLTYLHQDPSMIHIIQHDLPFVLSSKSILWIQHITQRQSEQYDVGYVTWPSSVALAQWLLNHPNEILNHQRTILELGSGTGLVGIVVAKLLALAEHTENHCKDNYNIGRRRVILSDYNPFVLDNIQRNIQLNKLQEYAEISCLDFYQHSGKNDQGGWIETLSTPSSISQEEATRIPHSCSREAVDIVLAADVICQPSDSVSLSKTIYDALKPGGKAFVTSAAASHRFGVEYFASECQKRGLFVTESSVIPDKTTNDIYLSATSGYVEGMEMKLYEIIKPSSVNPAIE